MSLLNESVSTPDPREAVSKLSALLMSNSRKSTGVDSGDIGVVSWRIRVGVGSREVGEGYGALGLGTGRGIGLPVGREPEGVLYAPGVYRGR